MSSEKSPLFFKIYDDLKRQIVNGEFSQGDLIPSEQQLSKQYNVSRITSKRALEELRQGGYIIRKQGKGSFAGDLSAISSHAVNVPGPNVILLVIPFSRTIDCAISIISGITSVLDKEGFYLSVQNSNSKSFLERRILDNLVKDKIKGLIYYPSDSHSNCNILLHLSLMDFPLVTIDKYFDGLPIYSIVPDNFSGGYKAAMHLAALGHKKIEYVSNLTLDMSSSIRDRYFGFCNAQIDSGLEIGSNNFNFIGRIQNGNIAEDFLLNECPPNNIDVWKKAVSRILDRDDPPTAIFTAYDYIGVGIMKAAQALGAAIPKELSIIGFDNIELTSYIDIPLTTIAQDFYKMGETAAETVIAQIHDRGKSHGNKVLLPVEIIKRQSTAKLAENGD